MLICAESAGRRETMHQYFAEYGLALPQVDDWTAFLGERRAASRWASRRCTPGSRGPHAKLAFVTEAELYAGVVRRGRRDGARRSNVDAMLRDLSEVRIGDPVVHEQHGIGRYLGLVALDLGEGPTEFLQLVYANDAKLYVPVSNLHLIGALQRRLARSRAAARARQRPMGEGEAPRRAAGARHGGGAAQPLRAARGAHRATRSRSRRTTTRRSPTASRSRRPPTSRRRSRR